MAGQGAGGGGAAALCLPARATLRGQQRAFDHSAPNTTTCGRISTCAAPRPGRATARRRGRVLPAITYPSHFTVKEVTAPGTFRLGPQLYLLSNSLSHYPVGLEEVDDAVWSVNFCHLLLARINLRTGTHTRG